jgi:hypothetical protein
MSKHCNFAYVLPPQEYLNKMTVHKKLYNMLKQAKTCITQLLESLTYIYSSNGVDFGVKEYELILIRMLSPFELLNQYGMADTTEIFLKNMQSEQFLKKDNLHQESEVKKNGEKRKNLLLNPFAETMVSPEKNERFWTSGFQTNFDEKIK